MVRVVECSYFYWSLFSIKLNRIFWECDCFHNAERKVTSLLSKRKNPQLVNHLIWNASPIFISSHHPDSGELSAVSSLWSMSVISSAPAGSNGTSLFSCRLWLIASWPHAASLPPCATQILGNINSEQTAWNPSWASWWRVSFRRQPPELKNEVNTRGARTPRKATYGCSLKQFSPLRPLC